MKGLQSTVLSYTESINSYHEVIIMGYINCVSIRLQKFDDAERDKMLWIVIRYAETFKHKGYYH